MIGLPIRKLAVAALVAFGLGCPPALADPSLSDLLRQLNYRQAWNAMLKSGEPVPRWVVTYARTQNGVDNPTTSVPIGGKPYRLSDLCQPHACDNKLLTLFRPDGKQAWALVVNSDGTTRWLGRPDQTIRSAILGARGR